MLIKKYVQELPACLETLNIPFIKHCTHLSFYKTKHCTALVTSYYSIYFRCPIVLVSPLCMTGKKAGSDILQ